MILENARCRMGKPKRLPGETKRQARERIAAMRHRKGSAMDTPEQQASNLNEEEQTYLADNPEADLPIEAEAETEEAPAVGEPGVAEQPIGDAPQE